MDLGFGMVPVGFKFVVVPISLVVCFFFFFFFLKVALVDVGLCPWWLVGVVAVVAIVAAVVDVPLLLLIVMIGRR